MWPVISPIAVAVRIDACSNRERLAALDRIPGPQIPAAEHASEDASLILSKRDLIQTAHYEAVRPIK